MAGQWWLHGLGMFCEAYVLFSIGNLQGLFQEEYPDCWKTQTSCSSALIKSLTYTEVGGVIAGMLTMGYIADKFGRRNGSRITALVMLIGCILLTSSYGSTLSGHFTMFTAALAIYGYGVGGEYPLASASAVERSQEKYQATGIVQDRGKEVVMTFSMQGVGNFVQTLIMVILMAAVGQTGDALDPDKLEVVWRTQYGIATVILAALVSYRLWKLQESSVWKRNVPGVSIITDNGSVDGREDSEAQVGLRPSQPTTGAHATNYCTSPARSGDHNDNSNPTVTGLSAAADEHHVNLWLFFKTQWHRLVGTSVGWMVWDVAFYGNKLFQGRFIAAIYNNPSVFVVLQWTLLNSAVALAGYYFAAFTIDKAWMGRWRMQMMGFVVCTITFGACGIWYDTLATPEYTKLFQFLYYMSTFFGQWGPNATTWLLPSELFPTEVRAFAHGISAAAGKVGALAAGFAFAHMTTQETFNVSAVCGLVGAAVTWLFLPEVSALDVSELDKLWAKVSAGEAHGYKGPAGLPRYQSYWERAVDAMKKGTQKPLLSPSFFQDSEDSNPVGDVEFAAASLARVREGSD